MFKVFTTPTRFNTRCQMVTPLLYWTFMTVWSGITSSINSLENCVILYRQCQLNKVDRMPTSTTYFRQIVVFHLDHERVFVETSVKLRVFCHYSVSRNIKRQSA